MLALAVWPATDSSADPDDAAIAGWFPVAGTVLSHTGSAAFIALVAVMVLIGVAGLAR